MYIFTYCEIEKVILKYVITESEYIYQRSGETDFVRSQI